MAGWPSELRLAPGHTLCTGLHCDPTESLNLKWMVRVMSTLDYAARYGAYPAKSTRLAAASQDVTRYFFSPLVTGRSGADTS